MATTRKAAGLSFSAFSLLMRSPFSVARRINRARMNNLAIISRDFSLVSPFSANPPYLKGDRIVFNPKSQPHTDWTPPLKVPDLFAQVDTTRCDITGDGIHKLVHLDLIGVELDTEQQLFHYYVKTFARAIGSEEEAKKRIYVVSCGPLYGFGAEFDQEVENKLQDDRNVAFVFDDTRFFQRNKDPKVQSVVRFTPMNLNYRLDSIFSYHHLSEPNPKWKSDHWLITIKQPDGGFIDSNQVRHSCIKMLAGVVGSEAAAIKNIYIVWFKFPFGFGAEIDLATSNKLRGLSDVLKVIPDFAFDIKEKRNEFHEALHVFPSLRGLRFSCCHLDKEYRSEDWLISMEEHVGLFPDYGYTPWRCYPNLNDPYLTTYSRRRDCKHWFIIMEKSCGEIYSFERRIDYCIQILATAARRNVKNKIYRIKCVSGCIGFGINVTQMTSDKLRGIQGVRGVLPDYSINKSYKARSVHKLTPNAQSHLLGDIFTYHHLSESYSLCKSDHWLIHIKEPNDGFSNEQQIINFCIQMLAELVGSEEHAKKKIYIVWCKAPFGFGARIDEKTLNLLKGLPNVLTMLPDRASDVTSKNRGALVISPSSFVPYNRRSVFFSDLVEDSRATKSEDEVSGSNDQRSQ